MKLNWAEKTLMNNPVRAAVQRHYEAPLLERLGGRTDGCRVLEIGCGRGVGTQIIASRFGASEVHAFDIDPDMIKSARHRLNGSNPGLRLFVGDATAIDEPDASFDAVFDFGAIHHVPDWRAVVQEVRRVLKPEGRFFFEEVTRHALDRRSYLMLFDHPEEDRFTSTQFIQELEGQQLSVGDRWRTLFFSDFVVGVAHRLS